MTLQHQLGAGLEALSDFYVSARVGADRLLLNVQVKHMACYRKGPLSAVIHELLRANQPDMHRLESALKHLRVRPMHATMRDPHKRAQPRVKVIGGLATPLGRTILPCVF